MMGVLANGLAILLGSSIGISSSPGSHGAGGKNGTSLGFCILLLAVKMGLEFEHALLVIGCVVLGGLLGAALGSRTVPTGSEAGCSRKSEPPAKAVSFTVSLRPPCSSARVRWRFVGSIQSGVTGNHEVLYAKSLMDGIFCIPFAATHGAGVLFSLIQ